MVDSTAATQQVSVNGDAGIEDHEELAISVSDTTSNLDSTSQAPRLSNPLHYQDQGKIGHGAQSPNKPEIGVGALISSGHGHAEGSDGNYMSAQPGSPKIVTEEKLKCYDKFRGFPLIIEGPEFVQDYSYFLVDQNDDLQFLERGILVEDFFDVRSKRKYDMEFRVLQRMTQHKDHVKNLCTSTKMEFKRQNRYNEVLPFNHSRVKLQSKSLNFSAQSPAQDDYFKCSPSSAQKAASPSNPFEKGNYTFESASKPQLFGGALQGNDHEYYINASYVNTLIRGYGNKAFIATQAPVEATIQKFWQMVWEQDCRLIVMLCPLMSSSKEESSKYWQVDDIGETKIFENLGLQLTLEGIKKSAAGLIKRTIRLKTINKDGDDSFVSQEKVVVQLQTTCWEDDNAITDSSHFEDIDKIIKYIKKHRSQVAYIEGKAPSPIVVHCSAGIGRTGTLIAIYAIIESIEWIHNHGQTILTDESLQALGCNYDEIKIIESTYPNLRKPRISVFGTVRRMREQRWSMVKKQVQYAFIYDYIERWVQKNRIDFEQFGDL